MVCTEVLGVLFDFALYIHSESGTLAYQRKILFPLVQCLNELFLKQEKNTIDILNPLGAVVAKIRIELIDNLDLRLIFQFFFY